MNTRLFRSFSMELMKVASGIPNDAAVRELVADREGEEFLPGGELPSNETQSAQLQKVAISSLIAAQIGSTAPISKSVHSKGPDSYQEKRDWALTALKGATGGVGATGLFHSLRGDGKGAIPQLGVKQVRRGAAIGAGIALGDRLIRRRAERKKDHDKDKEKNAGIVSPSPERVVKSPAGVLRAAQQTGAVKAKRPRMFGKALRGPVRLGTKKFQMPTRLGVR